MTIICALREDGKTWIGSDSRTTYGNHIEDYNEKWFCSDDGAQAIGFTGPRRLHHIIAGYGQGIFENLDANVLCAKMRAAIYGDDWTPKKDDGGTSYFDADAIYATTSGIWEITCDFSAFRVPDGIFLANGSGNPYAYGAAFVAMKSIPQGQRGRASAVIEHAIMAACKFNNACGGEIKIRALG